MSAKTLTIPSWVRSGYCFVGAITDESHQISEESGASNASYVGIRVMPDNNSIRAQRTAEEVQMGYRLTTLVTAHVLAAALLVPLSAFAAKEKFVRTKPHVNVGTLNKQEPRILIHNADTGSSGMPPCYFSGRLVGTDITPGPRSGKPLILLAEDVEIGPGSSLAVPIPPPDGIPGRREVRVEIEPNTHSSGPCPLMVSAVGYDSTSQATEYAVDVTGAQRDEFGAHQGSPERLLPLGFAGGNAHQFLRFVLTLNEGAGERDIGPGPVCDPSGMLHLQRVPGPGSGERGAVLESDYPVRLQHGRVVLDKDFSELGAGLESRVDVVVYYALNAPAALQACAGAANLTLQVIDGRTGKTNTEQKYAIGTYRPQFYFR
jgi:hypothetical protein